MNDLKRFSLRSVSDFLSEQEMKRVTGGYDPDPPGGFMGYDECCYCEFSIFWPGGSYSGYGGFCGHEGDPNCLNGLKEWEERMAKVYGDEGETINIQFVCQSY